MTKTQTVQERLLASVDDITRWADGWDNPESHAFARGYTAAVTRAVRLLDEAAELRF